MAYKAVDSYGMIGDLHSAALVGTDGSIDWCCLPRFDSPSIFAAILDDECGGYYKLAITAEARCKQMYLPDTNVLISRFLSADGVGEVLDFMPWQGEENKHHAIVRIARCVRGSVRFRLECFPAFDYARGKHTTRVDRANARFANDSLNLLLSGTVDLQRQGNGVEAEFVLNENELQYFVLEAIDGEASVVGSDVKGYADRTLDGTLQRWKQWAARCTYRGRWREMVVRSALTLKLLIYEPTGAIIAAPTCALPEVVGGVRNWDYRYTWVRDAAFTIYALIRLGYSEEATKFMLWLNDRVTENQETGPLQVMYRIDGGAQLPEFTLDHLKGYRDSKPVRIGNSASEQLQLDIYGELIDSIYLYNKYFEPISYDFWMHLRRLAEWVADNWKRSDKSIWEVRSEARNYTYSKMQCWVALDRVLRIALKRNLPLDLDKIRAVSQEIYETIMTQGWSEEQQSFVQVLDGEAIDATSLLFTLMLFVSPRDPRMVSTVERIQRELVADSLVYRYRLADDVNDGLPGQEGTFSVCTFWLVEALARAGKIDDARLIFEKMLTYANHLGLYAEQVGPTGEALGNYPQAFTHLGLISAALSLDKQLNEQRSSS